LAELWAKLLKGKGVKKTPKKGKKFKRSRPHGRA